MYNAGMMNNAVSYIISPAMGMAATNEVSGGCPVYVNSAVPSSTIQILSPGAPCPGVPPQTTLLHSGNLVSNAKCPVPVSVGNAGGLNSYTYEQRNNDQHVGNVNTRILYVDSHPKQPTTVYKEPDVTKTLKYSNTNAQSFFKDTGNSMKQNFAVKPSEYRLPVESYGHQGYLRTAGHVLQSLSRDNVLKSHSDNIITTDNSYANQSSGVKIPQVYSVEGGNAVNLTVHNGGPSVTGYSQCLHHNPAKGHNIVANPSVMAYSHFVQQSPSKGQNTMADTWRDTTYGNLEECESDQEFLRANIDPTSPMKGTNDVLLQAAYTAGISRQTIQGETCSIHVPSPAQDTANENIQQTTTSSLNLNHQQTVNSDTQHTLKDFLNNGSNVLVEDVKKDADVIKLPSVSLNDTVTRYCECVYSFKLPAEQVFRKKNEQFALSDVSVIKLGDQRFYAFKKRGEWYIPKGLIYVAISPEQQSQFADLMNSNEFKEHVVPMSKNMTAFLNQKCGLMLCQLISLKGLREICKAFLAMFESKVVRTLAFGEVTVKVLGKKRMICCTCGLSMKKANLDNVDGDIVTVGTIEIADLKFSAFSMKKKMYLNVSELMWKQQIEEKPLRRRLRALKSGFIMAPKEIDDRLMKENRLPVTGAFWVDIADLRQVFMIMNMYENDPNVPECDSFRQLVIRGNFTYIPDKEKVVSQNYVNNMDNMDNIEQEKTETLYVVKKNHGLELEKVVEENCDISSDKQVLVIKSGDYISSDIRQLRKEVKAGTVELANGTKCRIANNKRCVGTRAKEKAASVKDGCFDKELERECEVAVSYLKSINELDINEAEHTLEPETLIENQPSGTCHQTVNVQDNNEIHEWYLPIVNASFLNDDRRNISKDSQSTEYGTTVEKEEENCDQVNPLPLALCENVNSQNTHVPAVGMCSLRDLKSGDICPVESDTCTVTVTTSSSATVVSSSTATSVHVSDVVAPLHAEHGGTEQVSLLNSQPEFRTEISSQSDTFQLPNKTCCVVDTNALTPKPEANLTTLETKQPESVKCWEKLLPSVEESETTPSDMKLLSYPQNISVPKTELVSPSNINSSTPNKSSTSFSRPLLPVLSPVKPVSVMYCQSKSPSTVTESQTYPNTGTGVPQNDKLNQKQSKRSEMEKDYNVDCSDFKKEHEEKYTENQRNVVSENTVNLTEDNLHENVNSEHTSEKSEAVEINLTNDSQHKNVSGEQTNENADSAKSNQTETSVLVIMKKEVDDRPTGDIVDSNRENDSVNNSTTCIISEVVDVKQEKLDDQYSATNTHEMGEGKPKPDEGLIGEINSRDRACQGPEGSSREKRRKVMEENIKKFVSFSSYRDANGAVRFKVRQFAEGAEKVFPALFYPHPDDPLVKARREKFMSAAVDFICRQFQLFKQTQLQNKAVEPGHYDNKTVDQTVRDRNRKLVKEKSHKCEEKPHKSNEQSHKGEEKSHKSKEQSHKGEEKSHTSKEKSHTSEEKSHTSEDKSHKSKEKSHMSEDKSHKSKEMSHRSEDKSHKSEEMSHRSEDKSHKSKEMSHTSEDKSHKSKEKSHTSEDKSHKSKEKSHRSEDKSHTSEGKSHKSKEKSRRSGENSHKSKEKLHESVKESENDKGQENVTSASGELTQESTGCFGACVADNSRKRCIDDSNKGSDVSRVKVKCESENGCSSENPVLNVEKANLGTNKDIVVIPSFVRLVPLKVPVEQLDPTNKSTGIENPVTMCQFSLNNSVKSLNKARNDCESNQHQAEHVSRLSPPVTKSPDVHTNANTGVTTVGSEETLQEKIRHMSDERNKKPGRIKMTLKRVNSTDCESASRKGCLKIKLRKVKSSENVQSGECVNRERNNGLNIGRKQGTVPYHKQAKTCNRYTSTSNRGTMSFEEMAGCFVLLRKFNL